MLQSPDAETNLGVYGHSVHFKEHGGCIYVAMADGFRERVSTHRQLKEFAYADGWGIEIIDTLRNLPEGERILSVCNQQALQFYRTLISQASQKELCKYSYWRALELFLPALNALERLRGEELEVSLIRSFVLGSSLNYARERILEEIRIRDCSDEEFGQRIDQLLRVLNFEAQLIFETKNLLLLSNHLSTFGEFSYALPWIYSWQFYDNPRFEALKNCRDPVELAFYKDIAASQTKWLKNLRTSFCELEQAVRIRHGEFPIERFVGLPGVGKSETIRILMESGWRLNWPSELLESRSYIERIWGYRSRHLFQMRLLKDDIDRGEVDEVLSEYLIKNHWEAYYSYLIAAIKEMHSGWVDTYLYRRFDMDDLPILLDPSRIAGGTNWARILFYIESLPFFPVIASLGLSLQARISGNEIIDILKRSPQPNPFSLNTIVDEEQCRKEPYSIGILVRSALVGSNVVKELFQYMYGPTVYIDLPLEVCQGRLEQLPQGQEREVRLKDIDYWPSWRLIYLVLADVFPNIGVVYASVEDSQRKNGYRVLSRSKVAALSLVTSAFLRLRMISSDATIPYEEILSRLRLLREHNSSIFSSS